MRGNCILGDRSATTAIEFALIGSVFIPLCLGALDAGILLWTKGVLQSTAASTARCAALASTLCSDVQQFAVTQAGTWVFPGIIAKANVTQSLVCTSHIQLARVAITSSYWIAAAMPSPFGGQTLTATAYFPTAISC